MYFSAPFHKFFTLMNQTNRFSYVNWKIKHLKVITSELRIKGLLFQILGNI